MDEAGIWRAHKHHVSSKTLLIVAWMLTVLGVGWTVAGAVWALQTWRFVTNAVTASGVVTANISQGHLSCPQIRFQTPTGQNHVSMDQSACSNPPRYQVNTPVSVIYDPNAPDHAAIPTFSDLWVGQMVMGAMGVISLVIAMECFAVRRRRLRSEPRTYSPPGFSRLLVLPRLLMISGLIMVAVTVMWTLTKRRFVAGAASAPGVIVGQVYHPAAGRYGRSEYCPKVQFRTQTGNGLVFEDTTGCDKPPVFTVDMQVTVLYDRTSGGRHHRQLQNLVVGGTRACVGRGHLLHPWRPMAQVSPKIEPLR